MARPATLHRLIIYDDSCRSHFRQGLSTVWSAGARLYSTTHCGALDWQQALAFLSAHDAIDEVQFWMHGKWGRLFVGGRVLDRSALLPGHALSSSLAAVRERLSPSARFWFRTCETFGAQPGHDFARAWTDYFGRPAAGHTYVIGFWQSGLHRLDPGNQPHWSPDEGLLEGSPTNPKRAKWSSPREPNTIHCFDSRFPSS